MGRPRLGCQEPTFELVGDYAYSDGRHAVEMFRGYRATFYPCQEHEMELFLARDASGSYATLTIGISKPRQNGKSYGARYYAIWAACIEGKKVLFSAHHGKTVRKMFKAICDIVKGNPDIHRELMPNGQGIYKAAGSEGIYFANGGMIEFQTRTTSGARGETYDIIIVDEAQELTQGQLDAMKPTTLASDSGDPQMIYLGTPPGPDCPGTVFRKMRDKAHAGGEGTWWLEWSVDEPVDTADFDACLEAAYRTNPAMGYRIRERVMADAIRTATDVAGFNREYLNWWSKQHVACVIDEGDWSECALGDEPKLDMSKAPCFAVKFSLDGTRASIAAAAKMDDGRVYVEVPSGCNASCAGGIRWVEDFAASVAGGAGKVVIDGKAHADDLYRRLRGKKVPKSCLDMPMSSWVADACSSFVTAIDEGTIAHAGQQAVAYAVDNTTKRKIGNGGGFGFEAATEDADETLLEAMALAYQAAMTNKRNPKKKARAGC